MSFCNIEPERSGNSNTSSSKCMRPGPITTNGYLNFLRQFRKQHCGLTAIETVKQGAREWNRLSADEKLKYKMLGSSIKRTQRRNSRSRSRSKSPRHDGRITRGRQMSSRGANRRRLARSNKSSSHSGKARTRPTKQQSKAKSCMRPGRMTTNGYLNFLRDYRKNCCGMTAQETVRQGAKKWVSLSEAEKDVYRRDASKIKQNRIPTKRSSRGRC